MPPQQYWKIRKKREVIRSGRIKMVYVIMKSIKNLYFAVVLVVLAVGCSKLDSGMEQKSSPIFRASFEANEEEDVNEPGTKVYIDSDLKLHWDANDEISLFNGSSVNEQYRFKGAQGEKIGEFEKISQTTPGGVTFVANYAVYPYSPDVAYASNAVFGGRGVRGFRVSVPREQKYAENGFDKASNIMVAVTSGTDDFDLNFKNAVSYLVLRLYGKDVTVKSVTIKNLAEIAPVLSGVFYSGLAYNQTPSYQAASGEANPRFADVVLNCGTSGVKLGDTEEDAVDFWFVVIPGTASGMQVTIEDINGKTATISTANTLKFSRNKIKRMAPKEVVFN